MQIRTRLTLLFLVIANTILASVLLIVFFVYQKSTEAAFFSNLEARSEIAIKSTFTHPENLSVLPANWIEPDQGDLPYRDNLSLYNDNYQRVFTLHPESVPVSPKALQDAFTFGVTQFRHYNLHAFGKLLQRPTGAPFVVVTEGYCDLTESLKLRKILIISFVLGVFLMAVSGWYFAGQALAPVSQIMNEVDALYPTDMSKRIATGKNKDELWRLAETFNRMLDRSEQAFRMQRMFLSNVSHELRNPLTAIQTQLDVVLQRQRSPEMYQAALQSVLEDVRAISSVEERLHQLARIYNDPNAITLQPFRIDELLWQSKSLLQKRHPEYKVQLDFKNMPENDAVLYIQANEALLITAFLNLMDNGCKYSPDHKTTITAFIQPDGGHQIFVADQGQGIPPEEQALIFEPFFRSPQHLQIKGTGIGLSLVQSIFGLHHITLTIVKSNANGTVFKIQLPATRFSSPI
jgi:signal transduction histidine kinase